MKKSHTVSLQSPSLLLRAPSPIVDAPAEMCGENQLHSAREYSGGEEVFLRCRVESDDNGGAARFRIIETRHGATQSSSESRKQNARDVGDQTRKEDLIGSIAYEIRTPLNAMLGFVQLLEDRLGKDLGRTEQCYLTGIRKGADRLLSSLDMVHRIASMEAGTLVLERSRVDLVDLFKEQFDRSREGAADKGIALRLLIASGRTFVTADRECLAQAVGLLLAHAVTFTKRGSVVARLYDARDGDLCIDIALADLRVPDVLMPRSAVATEQENPEYSNTYRNLGLSLFKRYLDAMDIPIRVQRRKGEGSTFTLCFESKIAFSEAENI